MNFYVLCFKLCSLEPVKSLLAGDRQACFYCPENLVCNEEKYNGDDFCVYRSLCPIVPIGFFCLEQLKKRFKKSA